MNQKLRVIAFYLPQFHPTPENNKWWGKGFTEWTNVAKAKKYFPGHEQPHIPADLGFYDLRLSETREAQAAMAKNAGIEGFCYWHYWFGNGKELLERPFKEVLESGKPDFPFCLAWANESWQKKLWNKDSKGNETLIEQTYGGVKDYTAHFYSVLKAFKDERYIKVDGKPLFMIYKPLASSEIKTFMNTWNALAKKENLPGIFWVAHNTTCKNDHDYIKDGFNAVNDVNLNATWMWRPFLWRCAAYVFRHIVHIPYIARFSSAVKHMNYVTKNQLKKSYSCPSIITGWDHTPRSGIKGSMYTHYTPRVFSKYTSDLFSYIKRSCVAHGGGYNNIVFLKSWNEWGEGNYIEPDLKYGSQFLDVLKEQIDLFNESE
jgi:hypothetical protein